MSDRWRVGGGGGGIESVWESSSSGCGLGWAGLEKGDVMPDNEQWEDAEGRAGIIDRDDDDGGDFSFLGGGGCKFCFGMVGGWGHWRTQVSIR